ncbi:PilZ domain-containing protein [Paenibacillus xanthanilyticus]|uniref:PilZ domain-containing protein n=1 Tax=Paenibacillus xanthanilyticus TaxID=1783531 RepID=A0ABV8KAU9_9BACL
MTMNNPAVRNNMRIRLTDGTKAMISIYRVFGNDVQSGEIPVSVHNMSPTGMMFATHLRFPVSDDFAIRIKVKLGDWEFALIGHILWRRKEENQYLYGCAYLPDQKVRLAIVRALNEKLRTQNPQQSRIHDLYQRMTDKDPFVRIRLDARG